MTRESATLDARISDRLAAWRNLRAQGRTPTPEELCCDCPELVAEIKERLRAEEGHGSDSATTTFDRTQPKTTRRKAPPWPGIPGYEPLGDGLAGGMGVVYRVRDANLGREVAVKVLRAGQFASDRQMAGFHEEGKLQAALNHPHVVRIYGFDYFDNLPYIEMEWVDGGSLEKHQARLSADPSGAARLMEKIARAVQYLHANRVWHRDLKPANILLDEHGEPKISDFGLAKLLEADREETQSRQIVGTVAYMAPEQFKSSDSRPNEQTDIWSLGVTFFEMLAGRRPFAGDSNEELSSSIQSGRPPSLRAIRPELDSSLEVIILKCLEKDPRDRYASAEALADDLAKWQRGEPILPEPLPKRVWRKVKRYPGRTATLLAVAVVIAIAVPLVINASRSGQPSQPGDPPDPNREWQAIMEALLAGQTVAVIGETGPPRWSRMRAGEATAGQVGKDHTFALQSRGLALLELAPEVPMKRFRIQAQVRHDEGSDDCAVGLYVGHQHYELADGIYDLHWEFNFVDRGLLVDVLSNNGPRIAQAVSAARWYRDPKAGDATTGMSQLKEVRFPAKEGGWRTLVIDVTPESITARIDGVAIGSPISNEDAAVALEPILGRQPDVKALNPKWNFHQGVGIFAYNTSGSFRSVTIGPIPE